MSVRTVVRGECPTIWVGAAMVPSPIAPILCL